jgi:RIO-like serine/threonine protein kinase
VIDVGQAVEHDHPHALEFLRMDCGNVTDFFEKRGATVAPLRGLFDLVTDSNLKDKSEALAKLQLVRFLGGHFQKWENESDQKKKNSPVACWYFLRRVFFFSETRPQMGM